MFVTENTVSAIKNHFFEELDSFYPKTEVSSFFYILADYYLGFSKTDVLLGMKNNLSESELLKFHYAIKDLKKQKPIQFITGVQYFYENEFKVTEHTLIPRPETEELVDLIVKDNPNFEGTILDIGTGTGAIAISLDLKLSNSKVTAFDVSKEALVTAKLNNDDLKAKVDFELQDILNPNYTGEEFDIIVSNPPYVLNSEKLEMQSNVLDFEPHLALFVADNEPLIFYNAIIDFSKNNLKIGGKLYFEINEKYGKETVEQMNLNGFTSVVLLKDMNNKDRMVKGIKTK